MTAGPEIRISGQVRSYDSKPIMSIKVTLYSEKEELAHVFTGPDGRYEIRRPV